MSYYPDLSNKTMIAEGSHIQAIGWLSRFVKFPTGEVSREFIAKLEKFAEQHKAASGVFLGTDGFMGGHTCEFCNKFTHGGNIGVPYGDILFVAPAMIYHYVEEHNYLPPIPFINALANCPLPGSREYSEAISPFRILQREYITQVEERNMEDARSLCRRLNEEAKARQKAKKDG